MVTKYNFTRLAPFTQRGANFPTNVIRVRRTSLVIAPNIIEAMNSQLYTVEDGSERIKIVFGVDKKNKAIKLSCDPAGFVVQVRKNSAGYLNTTRIDFGLPIGDYQFQSSPDDGLVFVLAK